MAIEHTRSYTYLILVINASGNFQLARKGLYDKKKLLGSYNPPIKPLLFDGIIQPLLLQRNEIWGPTLIADYSE